MLYNQRTDLAFTNSLVWQYEIEHSGLNPDKIKFLYKIPDISSDLYIAANLKTSPEILQKLQLALQQIKADGRYQNIINKWQL
jgi:polar amino acid transport system substrate-binding protein